MALGLKLADSATWVSSLGDRSTWAVRRRFSKIEKQLQELDDGWPESEKGKDVDVKYIEERRRCEKISEERMNI